MDLKKLGKALLFPHLAIAILLVPVSTAFLVCSMVLLGSESPISIASYVLSAYTLTVWCVRIPRVIRSVRTFKDENRYVRRWREDDRLRVRLSLAVSLLMNVAYAAFQLGLGILHESFWFYSLSGYYASLAIMRFFLVRFTGRNAPGEDMQGELKRFRACGWIFLLMNLALANIVFFMVYWNRSFHHYEITTIAMAAYTFTAFALAIRNLIRYRKYHSPVYTAAKAISLASASVSMLTLESSMLTTFGDDTLDAVSRRWMLGATGGAISLFVILMALYMIVHGTMQLRLLHGKESTDGTRE